MPMSEYEQKMLLLQNQLRENQMEMQEFLKGLDNWETEISKKEQTLKHNKESDKTSSRVLPPIRNSSGRKKRRKVKPSTDTNPTPTSKPNQIRSYDYAAWEKLDVDKICEEISDEQSSSSESVTDEELEELQQKQQALVEKDKGNDYFKKGEYMLAIDHYSQGLQCDPTNPLLAANRAMALLKQDKYAAAEEDCNTCLKLDPTYIKGYLRRATARTGLHRCKEALDDYLQVQKLDPSNKVAQKEAVKLQKKMATIEKCESEKSMTNDDIPEGALFTDIYKPPSDRSKDKICEEISEEESSSSESVTDEELEELQQKQQALVEKDKGNDYFKKGEYMLAIDHYSQGLQCDPTNPLLAANRAMALLKQDKYAAAEEDCNTCLKLDPTYIKGYLRRATARTGLHRCKEALDDYLQVQKLDPSNKVAQKEAVKLQKKMATIEKCDSKTSMTNDDIPEGALFTDIYKPPSDRSKKPLRRIEIQEIGVEETLNREELNARMEKSRSEAQQRQIKKDKLSFQQYTQDGSKITSQLVEEIQPKPDETIEPNPVKTIVPKLVEEIPPKPVDTIEPKPVQTLEQKPVETIKQKPIQTLQQKPVEEIPSDSTRQSCPTKTTYGIKSVAAESLKVPCDERSESVINVDDSSFLPDPKKFQYNWPRVKKDSNKICQYLKVLTPDSYPSLVNQFIDAEMITKICANLPNTFPNNVEVILSHLSHLCEVKRFQMALMFLSSSEKQVIKELFDYLKQQPNCEVTELQRISKLYGIK